MSVTSQERRARGRGSRSAWVAWSVDVRWFPARDWRALDRSSGFPENKVEHLDRCYAAIGIRLLEPRDQASTHVTAEVVGEALPDDIVEFNHPSQPHLDRPSAWEPEAEVLQDEGVDDRHVGIDRCHQLACERRFRSPSRRVKRAEDISERLPLRLVLLEEAVEGGLPR